MLKKASYTWSINGHDFFEKFWTIEEAIVDAKGSYPDAEVIWVGEAEMFQPYIDGITVIEKVADQADDEVGDIAEIYLDDVNNDDAETLGKMLTETFNRWAEDTGNTPNIFSVVNIKRYDLSQLNIECHQCHFAARIPAWGGKDFLGCICPPYHGKMCCEMQRENKCPLKNSKKDVGLE